MASGNIDCDTELSLTPGGRSSSSRNQSGDGRPGVSVRGPPATPAAGDLQQKISIFYGGQVCICDVTEIQARAIICMAKREMEEKMKRSGQSASALGGSWPEPAPAPDHQVLNSRLSMKRSLQSFLQKRKTRACESSTPYPTQKEQNLHSDSSSSS
ncbi:protein TIFY 5A [Dendrobium catenatum]|uniref:protein TIFY 5A n=1 Tax=Dendrobium catenatum TaxID=906689 RepID=UPI0009F3A677|nr:protein TIFY 5A [Dendrobium catenatum]